MLQTALEGERRRRALALYGMVLAAGVGADSGWPAWCWPTLAVGAGVLAWFARHVRRLASQGRAPLIEPSLFGRNGVRVPLGGAFALMSCYGGVLFTTAIYLQNTLHDSALRAGLTFAAYAAGFATASLTWARLPVALHARVPAAGFALISAATAALPWRAAGLGTGTPPHRWPQPAPGTARGSVAWCAGQQPRSILGTPHRSPGCWPRSINSPLPSASPPPACFTSPSSASDTVHTRSAQSCS